MPTKKQHRGKRSFRIALALGASGALAYLGDGALAQIIPDTTLGSQNSTVTSISPTVEQIDGGATRGANLFHSFQEFNVGEGRSVYFTNPAGIENILTRVTGTNLSNIFGTLGVSGGNANLFVINPNGIIFGQNARLDVGGSFVASTASSLNFADGTQFSATNPQTPPLLTVSVPIGLQFGRTAGSIRNESQATNSSGEIVGLQVQPGKTLALVGGNVSLDGGKLQAPGGRVELAGVAGSGTVGLNVNGNNLGLSFADGVELSDVSLTNGAEVNVRAGGGGSIAINARNLNISGDSTRVRAGIDSGLGSVDSKAGDIEIKAIEAINIDASVISNAVLEGGIGDGGDINITAGSLSLTDGARLIASTFGQGNSGSIFLQADNSVSLARNSGIFNQVATGSVGNGGDINITAGSLSITDGARLSASTFGQGNSGSIFLQADNSVSLAGTNSAIFNNVGTGGVGNSGNININARSLSITDGAVLSASVFGQGNSGSVNINARGTVSFDGGDAASVVGETGVGDGGNINITAGSLSLTDGAQLAASTFGVGNSGSVFLQVDDSVSLANSAIFSKVEAGGVGNGGDINITAGSLSLTDGAQLQTFVANRRNDLVVPVGGRGNAGDVNIYVRDTVTLVGKAEDSGTGLTAIITGVGVLAEGDGGDININARSLSLTNAQLGSDTSGNGDAGDIIIWVVESIYLTNTDDVLEGLRRSRIGSAVTKTAIGNAGNIEIQARSLVLDNGAVLDATTQGNGNAGNIWVRANTLTATNGGQILTTSRSSGHAGTISLDIIDSVTLSGSDPNFAQRRDSSIPDTVIIPDSPASGIFARTEDAGAAGNLSIKTGQLIVGDGAQVTVSSTGSGIAGSLIVEADAILLDNQASISADTTSGQGDITLQTGDLILRRGSNITTNATGTATGGNITIDADNLVAVPKENSDISANAQESFGGRVIINASGIFGTQFRDAPTPLSDITATGGRPEFNGIVQLNTPNIDPSRGLTNLPTEPVDASSQINQNCATGGRQVAQNEFIVTGRGGLPPNPSDPLSPNAVWIDLDSTTQHAQNRPSASVAMQPTNSKPVQLVEAQGWVINDKGQVVLTASAPTVTPHSPGLAIAQCHIP